MNLSNKKHWKGVSVMASLLISGGLTISSVGASQSPKKISAPFVHEIGVIGYPAPYVPTTSVDISWVDSTLHGYYLADRTNGGVDMVNTKTDTFGGVLGGFALAGTQTAAQKTACGSAILGPNGVTSVTIKGVTQVWAGDGVTATNPVSSAKVFLMSSATSGTFGASIPTGDPAFGTTGTCRADELSGDPVDGMVLVANNADAPPYVSLITANAVPSQDAVVAQIKFPTATGIEQSLYDAQLKKFFVNVDNVGLVEISPKTKTIVHTYAQPDCPSPTGLVLDPTTQELYVPCGLNPHGSILMNARNGKVVTHFPEISGTDEAWYDPGTNMYYSPSGKMTSNGAAGGGINTPEIGMISGGGTASDPVAHWVGSVPMNPTVNVRAMAVDAGNHQMFMLGLTYGILVFKNSRVRF